MAEELTDWYAYTLTEIENWWKAHPKQGTFDKTKIVNPVVPDIITRKELINLLNNWNNRISIIDKDYDMVKLKWTEYSKDGTKYWFDDQTGEIEIVTNIKWVEITNA